jgi:hypothetical protein
MLILFNYPCQEAVFVTSRTVTCRRSPELLCTVVGVSGRFVTSLRQVVLKVDYTNAVPIAGTLPAVLALPRLPVKGISLWHVSGFIFWPHCSAASLSCWPLVSVSTRSYIMCSRDCYQRLREKVKVNGIHCRGSRSLVNEFKFILSTCLFQNSKRRISGLLFCIQNWPIDLGVYKFLHWFR